MAGEPKQCKITVIDEDGSREYFGRVARIVKAVLKYEAVFAVPDAKGQLVIPFKDDNLDEKLSIMV